MLSRVAQNIYWMARYVERAEDTARLISVNDFLLLDLPRNTLGWEPLVFISGAQELFYQNFKEADESNVIQFLVGDRKNPGSLLSSLSFARENLRTTRDVVLREAWEQINDLYIYVRDHLVIGMSRRGRYGFLKRIIQSTQQITGLLAGTMTHSAAYIFVRIGRNLERADMTTRILDVRSASLLIHQTQVKDGQEQEEHPFENIQWMSVLKSLSAYQMYRQQVRLRVQGPDVLKFLLQDPLFPRAVYHCLGEIEECLGKLPKNSVPLESISQLKECLTGARVPELALSREALHAFIDELQIGLGHIHDQLTATYFAR